VQRLFDQSTVQTALGVRGHSWTQCQSGVDGSLAKDENRNLEKEIPAILAANINVLVYSGVYDFMCNWFGGQAWTNAVQWPGQSQFNSTSYVDWVITSGSTAGEFKNVDNFTFLKVYNAGHMVPMNQPQAALEMLNTFLQGKPFTSGQDKILNKN